MHGDFGGEYQDRSGRWLPRRAGAAWGLIGDALFVLVAVLLMLAIASVIFPLAQA